MASTARPSEPPASGGSEPSGGSSGRWLALQVSGQGELGTELTINNSRRRSHALAGCCRIPLFTESSYFQRSSSSLLAGELLNSSSAPFPLYHVCVFLLSYLDSDRLFPSIQLCRSRVLWASIALCALLCSLLLCGKRKRLRRWTCPTDPPLLSIR